jgi:hypothetical protein
MIDGDVDMKIHTIRQAKTGFKLIWLHNILMRRLLA